MKKARYPLGTPRYLLWVYLLILTIVFSACGSPTPITVVVTATSLPPTEGVVEPTATLVPVNLSGPQSGDKIRWIDGSNLIYVPPGEFVMGNGGFDAPVHNVTLDGYWMYQTKVTNRMFAQCVAVGSCTPPTEELGGPVYSNPEYANHPVVGVTWDQAQAYCGWANGQLPTEAQWEKAARGLAGNLYPWGNDEPACDLVNFGYCLGRTTEVDAFPDGASDFGLYDMAGNLFEWVSDWYSETYYSEAPAANPLGPDSGQYRVIRGSSFETDLELVESAIRHFGAQGYHTRDIGFRCTVPQPQLFAPYCQLSAYIPSGVIVSNGCQLPEAAVEGQYCAVGRSFATVSLSPGAIYQTGEGLECEEAIVDGQRILTCVGPFAQEATNEITVCNPTCSNSPDVTGATPTCDPGYTLDPTTNTCNYSPVPSELSVAGCPVGYNLVDRGGQQTCVIATNANGECPNGLYYDDLAGRCVPPNGLVEAPIGINNAPLAAQSYSGCAAGFTYSDTFQCCQAVTGGTYPGCSPGSTFNRDLGACSPGEIRLAGPGCVTLDVTTLKCSQPVDVCSRIKSETTCIRNSYACKWDDEINVCTLR
ncbi:MAG TPA: formylglycine-generating enzyme family protein [Anaerolineales bacterium]|nr:formylglycine-generating enzyme family protein [Anaerolineales bacterium]